MDLNELVNVFSNLVFPIACCVVLFKQNGELRNTLSDISLTMQKFGDRLDRIEQKLK